MPRTKYRYTDNVHPTPWRKAAAEGSVERYWKRGTYGTEVAYAVVGHQPNYCGKAKPYLWVGEFQLGRGKSKFKRGTCHARKGDARKAASAWVRRQLSMRHY